MTAAQAITLHFDGKEHYAKKRIQQLKAAGLIERRVRRVNESAILFLAEAGLKLLQARGMLDEFSNFALPALLKRRLGSPLTDRHEIKVMDVKTAFHASVRRIPGHLISEFSTWPRQIEFTVSTGEIVKPDGFMRIAERTSDSSIADHAFFLEIDRSTEKLETLVFKAARYAAYYRSGGFAERNGAPLSSYAKHPFRVLMILDSAERRNNLLGRLLQRFPSILTQVHVATFEEVMADPFGAIWIRPVDYRNALRRTAFEVRQVHGRAGYRRDLARDVFVQKSVPKRRLLAA